MKASDGGFATIVVRAMAEFAGAVDDGVAVIMTMLPDGGVAGAVYAICPPLAVCAGAWLKLPHVPALPQFAVQSTPRLAESPVTLADRVACEPAIRVAGGTEDIDTVIGADVTIFAVAVAETAEFVVDFAVIVTLPLGGGVDGPVKVAELPLAV